MPNSALEEDLGHGPTALDTCIFIYLIEENPRYLPALWPIFDAANRGRRQLATSALTLLEVLVVPYRAGDPALAARYERLLTRGCGLRLLDVSRAQCKAAAQLRAGFALRTPDALQLAAALEAGCSAFLTNDRRLPAIPGLRILQLSAYANSGPPR
jgi:predicted nucleic acid-binding protein